MKGKTNTFFPVLNSNPDNLGQKLVKSLSSKSAKEFLKDILDEVNYELHKIQTDNGSEFKGLFDQAIQELKNTNHVWSYPKSPKTNGYVERFNWTIQDEFINYEIDTAIYIYS